MLSGPDAVGGVGDLDGDNEPPLHDDGDDEEDNEDLDDFGHKPEESVADGHRDEHAGDGHEPTMQRDPFVEDEESGFFSYFMFVLGVCAALYVLYHNRRMLIALVLEGRRRNGAGGGAAGRRKHTAAYRKLDANLEEAIGDSGASVSAQSQQIIY